MRVQRTQGTRTAPHSLFVAPLSIPVDEEEENKDGGTRILK